MDLDRETVNEIRAILGRNCVVEVTVAFYDSSDDALEPIDIGATIDFDAGTPPADQQAYFEEMLDSLRDVFRNVSTPE